MPLRYYPSFTVTTDLTTQGDEFTLNGQPYKGKYYETYDGRVFTGPNPQQGPNQELRPVSYYVDAPILNNRSLPLNLRNKLATKTGVTPSTLQNPRIPGQPNTYYPQPTEQDYKRGYVIRYFTKKENERGFITEISQDEYNSIVNGTADYDISIYQTTTILWKLTGPLRSKRESQYNIIPGIFETNQRLTEKANLNFLGIVDYIGGEYTKYSRPT
jgi:hypothetical protein